MSQLTWAHRVYFAAVGLLALRVGFVGYFNPGEVVRVIPWQVPPLHSRFLGSMYISGLVFMIGAMLVRRWCEVRVVVPMIAIWTGMLFVVSLLHIDEFDYSRMQVWIWYGAYFVYPAIAIWLAWRYRADTGHPEGSRPVARWARVYLNVQGAAVTAVALALLFAPTAMVDSWPWKATPLLLQIYASPFLSYGVGSLMLARQEVWSEVKVGVASTFVFSALVLGASMMHRPLFSFADVADRIWFASFGLSTGVLAILTVVAFAGSRVPRSAVARTVAA